MVPSCNLFSLAAAVRLSALRAWFILLAVLFLILTPLPAHAIRSTAFENPTSPQETRAGGFDADASGRFLLVAAQCPDGTMVLVGCVYETASGLREWLNQDPIGESGGVNLYAYVLNNPLNHIDPFGLSIFPKWPLDQLREIIRHLDQAMERLPTFSPEWKNAYEQRNKLYGELFRRQKLRSLCLRGGGAAGAFAGGWAGGRYLGGREVEAGTGVTLDQGMQELLIPFWDWVYHK